ncbi:MAG: aminopeptidase, partial [Elusimicrobiales bacterium]|nr:aminopeptidase [Elusimicrobiales bacterium]
MNKKKTTKKMEAITYTRKNGYTKISPATLKNIENFSKTYLTYLGDSKTEREAHDEAIKLLDKAGFKNLADFKSLKAGDKVYKSCDGKTLMAVVIGKQPLEKGMHILGAHTDSPRIDIKQNPLYEAGDMALLDTHYYGGIKKYQWVTIPLAIHGVFIKPNGKKITINIGENPNEPVLCISDILPHLAQDQMGKSMAKGIEGENLDIIVGSIPVNEKNKKEAIKHNVLKILNKKYGIVEEDFLSAEIEIVPAARPRHAGLDESMILGYGQDDRVCAYASLEALLNLKQVPHYTSCVLLCDKEEIGSVGATGMASNFFENVSSELVNLAYPQYNELILKRMLNNS